MCLVVKNKWHKEGKPLIAEEDFVVFKVLHHNDYGMIVTPFRFCEINFVKGKRVMTSKIKITQTRSWTSGYHYHIRWACSQGLHALLKLPSYHELHLFSIGIGNNMLVHKAIIPKGAKYFIGTDGDIVSDKMIIYEKTLRVR